MPRQIRTQSPVDYYHVIMKGNNRENIFLLKSQKRYLKDLLIQQIEEDLIDIAAYCIMDNHVHIAIKAELVDLTKAIKSINIKYAMKYNKQKDRVGHVFQNRYKSEVIANENHLLMVIRYIHNNPVKAKMVELPNEYIWSSYNEYIKRAMVISYKQKEFLLGHYNGINEFIKFHKEKDNNEFLEIKEDRDRYRLEYGQEIIAIYLREKGINEDEEINKNKGYLYEIINNLLDKSKLSHRQIANLLGISSSTVHKINLERR